MVEKREELDTKYFSSTVEEQEHIYYSVSYMVLAVGGGPTAATRD